MDKCLHLDVRIYIYPKGGQWTQQDIDQVLHNAHAYSSLEGIRQDRGFSFPSNDSIEAFIRSRFRDALGNMGTADIRTMGPSTYAGMDDPGYEYTFKVSRHYLETITLVPKYGATLQQMVDLAKVFEALGHIVVGSEGFDYKHGNGALRYNIKKRYVTLTQARAMDMNVK